jgi:hypothetical protein
VSFELLFLRALDGSSAMLLCGPQRVPNPAHSDPQGWPPQLTSKY